MRSVFLFFLFLFFTLSELPGQIQYPDTRKSPHTDTYHGIAVPDPYNWLECDTCEEVKQWVVEQNKTTENYLSQIKYRNAIKERLTQIWSFPYMSAPFKRKEKFFFYKNNGKQNHSVLYWYSKKDTLPKALIDPNTFPGDGTTSLNSAVVSLDGKYIAYAVSHKGSDWNEIFIREIETGKDFGEKLKWVKFSGISWKNNGFFYSRYDVPRGAEYSAKNEYHKVYYHTIGQPQEKDLLIFSDEKNPLRNFSFSVTNEGKTGILSSSQGTSGNSLAIADLTGWKPGSPVRTVPLTDNFNHDYQLVGVHAGKLILITNENASNRKLIQIDPKKPERKNWKELVAEKESVLESATLAGGKLVLKYLENVSSRLYLYSVEGKMEKEIVLPVIGTVTSVSGSWNEKEIFYSMVSYTFPSRIYKVDLKTLSTNVYFKPEIDFKSEDYVTKQVWYTSKDGTKIPMFVTHKKGLIYDGKNPLFLFGYGGFNISYTPEFRVDRTVFLENNGIYCVANIRGGGEFGEQWHKAGTKLQKQNVFDDFIAAADFLIREGYTSKERIAIHGRSNGGLLAGACLTQRPDLFKCVIPQVGVLDMLKFHQFTIGWAWKGDYGSSENKEQFEYLLKYSPVHNVKKQKYPSTMVVTGDHDDRVVPAHSFKFIAELQEHQTGKDPVIIRIDTGGGHGSGKPLSMQIAEYSDMWAFVFYNLGIEFEKR